MRSGLTRRFIEIILATNLIIQYCSTWMSGKWSKWQIYHNPPGWSNTNSNIESFNATIKRDFSLRRRYTVYGSVNIIKEIISYYSVNTDIFQLNPRFEQKIHESDTWSKNIKRLVRFYLVVVIF